ncbi:winged helix-turn-helix domain-containing protein [Halorussus lipolyticus]|uniref:winged helix-turn-helix domain-containing protein n=1 Tax=Halorussus lipolyticus TaxID=3034024 RepID=UPI0023E81572|nr:winged helix-turn-helix domain-containing protein [Halorussus sp. DT80]
MPTDENADGPPSIADIDPFDSEDLSGETPDNLDEAVTEEWKASTTAFQRIHTVLKNTYEPHTTGEIADAAATTKPTVRKHVEPLVEAGMVVERRRGNAVEYVWNQTQRRINRVAELADEHSSAELDGKIRRAKERIAALEDEYGVESPNELAEVLDPDDDAGWDDLATWRSLEDDLNRLEAAQSMAEYLVGADSVANGYDASNHV